MEALDSYRQNEYELKSWECERLADSGPNLAFLLLIWGRHKGFVPTASHLAFQSILQDEARSFNLNLTSWVFAGFAFRASAASSGFVGRFRIFHPQEYQRMSVRLPRNRWLKVDMPLGFTGLGRLSMSELTWRYTGFRRDSGTQRFGFRVCMWARLSRLPFS